MSASVLLKDRRVFLFLLFLLFLFLQCLLGIPL